MNSKKISSRSLRRISDEEFSEFCRVKKRQICGARAAGRWIDRAARRSLYRRVIRRMQLIRHPRGERRAYRRIKNYIYKESRILNSIYPNREKDWVNPKNRNIKK